MLNTCKSSENRFAEDFGPMQNEESGERVSNAWATWP